MQQLLPMAALALLLPQLLQAAPSKLYACRTAPSKAMGYCDPTKDLSSRVADLLGRLSQTEKISLMGAHGSDICAFEDGGVPRLDIPSYAWCTETNTGYCAAAAAAAAVPVLTPPPLLLIVIVPHRSVSSACLQEGRCATTFPSPAALAASFNRTLWKEKGATQSTEMRALFNFGAHRDHGGTGRGR